MKAEYKKHTIVGTGGINCWCCCNRGLKPTLKRQAKRRLGRVLTKLIKEETDGNTL